MLITKPYDRTRALEYAKKWALSRNPLFFDFTGGGGNCTNFVSQSLLAGSLVMDERSPFGWYYTNVNDRAPAWTGVKEFYEYLTGAGDFSPISEREGPFGEETDASSVELGDVVQLANSRGTFYHSLLVTGFTPRGEILISAQSNDALDRPLYTYNYASARYLHVLGVNAELRDPQELFTELINGTALPPTKTVYAPIPE